MAITPKRKTSKQRKHLRRSHHALDVNNQLFLTKHVNIVVFIRQKRLLKKQLTIKLNNLSSILINKKDYHY